MGRDTGELRESEFVNTAGFVNTYERSKYEAEQLVFASADKIAAAVFRLSAVAGPGTRYLRQALRFHPTESISMPASPSRQPRGFHRRTLDLRGAQRDL